MKSLVLGLFAFFCLSHQIFANEDQLIKIAKTLLSIENIEKNIKGISSFDEKEKCIMNNITEIYNKKMSHLKDYPVMKYDKHEVVFENNEKRSLHVFVHFIFNEKGDFHSVIIGDKKILRSDLLNIIRWPQLLSPLPYVIIDNGHIKQSYYSFGPQKEVSNKNFLTSLKDVLVEDHHAGAIPLLFMVIVLLLTSLLLFILTPTFLVGFCTVIGVSLVTIVASFAYWCMIILPYPQY